MTLCINSHTYYLKSMRVDLDTKIENVLNDADRMFIATSVGGNSSGASVFFNRDGEDLIFFTFNTKIYKCDRLFKISNTLRQICYSGYNILYKPYIFYSNKVYGTFLDKSRVL